MIVSDAPAVCEAGRSFCLAGHISDTATALVLLDPTTGRRVRVIFSQERNMAVAQPGNTNEGDLWQTNDAAPTLMRVSAAGQPAWTKSMSSLFGGSQ